MRLNSIVRSDIIELIPYFQDNSIDAIITSPPYNYDRDYDSYNDNRLFEEHLMFLRDVFKGLYDKLRVGGRLIINMMGSYKHYYPLHIRLANELMNIGYLFRNEIIWDKHNYNCHYTTWGSWCKPSAPYLKVTWEFIYVFSKRSRVMKADYHCNETDLTPEEFKKWTTAMWSIASETRMKQFDHPAMFPEELVRRLIKLFTWKNAIVLDPFNGVGTTTKVAAELERRFIGVDISEKYCLKALKRTGEVFPKVVYCPDVQSFR